MDIAGFILSSLIVNALSHTTQRMNTIRNTSFSNGFAILYTAIHKKKYHFTHLNNSTNLTQQQQNPVHSLFFIFFPIVVPFHCESDEQPK